MICSCFSVVMNIVYIIVGLITLLTGNLCCFNLIDVFNGAIRKYILLLCDGRREWILGYCLLKHFLIVSLYFCNGKPLQNITYFL